jgi:hypothetical protein
VQLRWQIGNCEHVLQDCNCCESHNSVSGSSYAISQNIREASDISADAVYPDARKGEGLTAVVRHNLSPILDCDAVVSSGSASSARTCGNLSLGFEGLERILKISPCLAKFTGGAGQEVCLTMTRPTDWFFKGVATPESSLCDCILLHR